MFLLTLVLVLILHNVEGLNSECNTKNCLPSLTDTSTSQINNNCLQPYCSCINQDILICSNFNRFSDLNFTKTGIIEQTFKYIELYPTQQLDLNEELQLAGLKLHGTLSIHNLKSIRLDYNPFQLLNYVLFNLAIVDSNFNYKEVCSEIEIKQDFIFSNLKLHEVKLVNVNFTQPVCACMFRNSKIDRLIISEPIGIFSIDKTNFTSMTMNISISEFEFKFKYSGQSLDPSLVLEPEFFKDLKRISLDSISNLVKIEQNTFRVLPNLKNLIVSNLGLKELLIRSNDWLNGLNYDQPTILWEKTYPVDVRSIQKEIFKFIINFNDPDDWEFTDDKDICLFRSFPHESMVFPFLVPSAQKFKCTCTIYWLYKNLSKYQLVFNLNEDVMPVHCFSDQNWYNHGCDFDILFDKYCPRAIQATSTPFISSNTTTQESATIFNITIQPTSLFNFTENTFKTTQANVIKDTTPYSLISFIVALVLIVIAAFMLAVLFLMYYKVFFARNDANRRLIESDSLDRTAYI